jgi:AraC-like DNA-binding protein
MFIGLLVGLVLIFYGFRKNRQNVLLGIGFLILTYVSFIIWLVVSGNFVHFPHLYRTGNFMGLLFIPLVYLYIRNTVSGTGLHKWDILHLIPALVFFLDYLPIYLLSTAEKVALIKSEIEDPYLFTTFTQSRFFPDNFYTPVRSVILCGYWLASVYLLWGNWKKQPVNDFSKEWNIWIVVFLLLELMVFFPFFLVFWFVDSLTGFYLVFFTVVVLTFGTAFSLFFFPKILYGLDLNAYSIQQKKNMVSSKGDNQENLSSAKIDEISLKFELVLGQKKHYLKHGYSIHDLSEDTGFPVYILTIYINKVLGATFPDLINQKRIEECSEIIKSGKHGHLSMEGLAELCGFNNRNSFSLAFKKHKGMAPSAFYKAHSSRDKEAFS